MEEYFPRGGTKPAVGSIKRIKRDFDLFKADKGKVKFSKRQRKNTEEAEDSVLDNVELTTVNLLRRRTLKEEMVVLGCVRDVNKMSLGISLPGRIFGKATITNISSAFTNSLHSAVEFNQTEECKTLADLFHPGKYVAVKVVKVEKTYDMKVHIELSLMPEDVNGGLTHTALENGMVLWGAVNTREEHGYVIDLGIKNCRAFLPLKSVEDNRTEYVIGEVLWFAVEKCQKSPTAATIVLNTAKENVKNAKLSGGFRSDQLLPGMKLSFTISKVLNNGLEGTFFENCTGYIHEGHLRSPFENITSFYVGQIIEARVMYVAPVTKFVYLTLKSLESYVRPQNLNGKLVTAKVLDITQGGLYVTLKSKVKGFVSFSRLKSPLLYYSGMDDLLQVRENYPVGSSHPCRILTFDYMERIYIGSLEQSEIEEKVYSLSDLKVAEKIEGSVKEIRFTGIVLQIGNVTGFVQNIHLSDLVTDSHEILKNKYRMGQKVQAKVWVVNESKYTCLLTLRPSFLNAEENLSSPEQAVPGKKFPGLITKIMTSGLIIHFFGDVYGFVPASITTPGGTKNLEKLFKVGQTVTCYVISNNIEANKLLLSLVPLGVGTGPELKLGQRVDATITRILESAFEVSVENSETVAIVPFSHITTFYSLKDVIRGMFQIGDKLQNLVCIQKEGKEIPRLSTWETNLTETNIPTFYNLKPGFLLPASVQHFNEYYMYLYSPIKNFNGNVAVNASQIVDGNFRENCPVQIDQLAICKITKVDQEKKRVYATTKLRDCWNGDLNISILLLADYLNEVDRIQEHFKSQFRSIASLKLGQRISGTVKQEITSGGYLLRLKNGAVATVKPGHFKGNLEVGTKVKGVVLWLDFGNNMAEVTLHPKQMLKINVTQNQEISAAVLGLEEENLIQAEVLLINPDFVLVTLIENDGNKQLAFLPSRVHINDFLPDLSFYSVGKTIDVQLVNVENGKILGVAKALKTKINERYGSKNTGNMFKNKAKKRKIKENISVNNQHAKKVVVKKTVGGKKSRISKQKSENKVTKKKKVINISAGEETKNVISEAHKRKIKKHKNKNISEMEIVENNSKIKKKSKKINGTDATINPSSKIASSKQGINRIVNKKRKISDACKLRSCETEFAGKTTKMKRKVAEVF